MRDDLTPKPALQPPAPPDFFQRRLESLERELAVERERAVTAQNAIQYQEKLRSEVEAHLKSLTEQLRREKAERDNEETKSHARGRIDALEKRLDEMHQSMMSLLKDAIAKKDLAGEKMEGRLQNFSREKAALLEAMEEQNHSIRQEYLKEKISRDSELAQRFAQLNASLERLSAQQEKRSGELSALKAQLEKTLDFIQMTPKAKDDLVAALELEKLELRQALDERNEDVRKYIAEHKETERVMGETLTVLHREIDEERRKHHALAGRIADLEVENAGLKNLKLRYESAQKITDEERAALIAQRDQLIRALAAEDEKLRSSIEERMQAGKDWEKRFNELQKKIDLEIELRAKENAVVSELRAQLATLTEHMAKALQEKEAVVNRFANWDQERQKLIKIIKEKDEMISMLNSSFLNAFKKP